MGGRAFVVLAAGGSIAVGLAILALALFIGGPTNIDVACQETPRICVPVRDYAAAWNSRDAEGMAGLMTERGLRAVLNVASTEELAENLDQLPVTDIIEQLQITSVAATDETAVVRLRFTRLNLGREQEFRLVLSDGSWLIDDG